MMAIIHLDDFVEVVTEILLRESEMQRNDGREQSFGELRTHPALRHLILANSLRAF